MSDNFSFNDQQQAGTTAAPGTQPQFNTASYTAPTTAYGGQSSQPQPVFVSYPAGAAQQPKKKLSVPARVLLWICGIAGAATFLFLCAVVWTVGLRALVKPSAQTEAQTQPPSGSYGNFGNSGGGQNGGGSDNGGSNNGGGSGSGGSDDYGGFSFGDDFGSVLPYIDGDEEQQKSSSAGLGIRVTEINLEFTVEGKYDAGVVIVEINEGSSFEGTDVRANDLIVELDGEETPTVNRLKALLGQREVGDTVELTMARYENGVASTYKTTVTLIDLSEE